MWQYPPRSDGSRRRAKLAHPEHVLVYSAHTVVATGPFEGNSGNVFEEVVTKVDQTFEGPSGPISGGLAGTETHQDGTLSDKLFAPGYGEFRSTDGPDVEAMALARRRTRFRTVCLPS